jgi:hypothetical protein
MRRLNTRSPRTAGLLALVLGAVALLALSGVATAKDRHGDDHGGHHGRHHDHRHQFPMREAGTISSFDATTGKLTIALSGSDTVGGLVTTDTRIRCEGVDDRLVRRDRGGDDNGGHGVEPGEDNGGQLEPGDDHGGRGTEPGDDNGGKGNEPGDDNGGDSAGPGPSGSQGQPTEGTPAPVPGAPACTVASLTPGAVVGEAELRLEGGAAVFTEVDLGFDS